MAVSDAVATEEVPGGRAGAGTETAASPVPAKLLVRALASLLLTEQAKDGFDSANWLQVTRSHYCRLLCRSPGEVRVKVRVRGSGVRVRGLR